MKAIPYCHVDAFASQAFGGNQAAVMLFDAWPDDGVLAQIAAENMFAETAFLVPTPEGRGDLELRWFTPQIEVAMCGHATLAAGHVMLGQDAEREVIRFSTRKAGLLAVSRSPDGYALSLPAVTVTSPAPDGMASGLGVPPEAMVWDEAGYLICRYASQADVCALAPDMAALASHGDTMFIATAPGETSDIVSRVFVPGAGIPEDSVTGSAHAALTPFWADILHKDSFTAHQASQRGGDLTCRLEGDRVILGGQCVTVVKGLFYLPG